MATHAFPAESRPKGNIQFDNVLVGSFCKALSPEALSDFGAIVSYSSRATGMVLYSEDQIPAKIFILLRGQMRVSINARNGRRLILRIAKPGEVLGLSSAFSGNVYEETAEAISPCNLISLRCAEFAAFLKRHPTAFQSIMQEFGTQYEQVCARLCVTGMNLGVTEKLARLLVEWTADSQQTEYGIRIDVALTHAEIAECIGTCRESVTRILSDMQCKHIVTLRGSILTVTNRLALEACAGM
jgi:CRP/FNR family transcriptional regulator